MKQSVLFKFSVTFIFALFSFQFALANTIDTRELDNPEDAAYLPFAEVMPKPVDGVEAIYKNITYPDIAKKAGIEGKVYVLVYVNENGGVDDVKVIKGIGAGCDEAAAAGVKKVKFTAGKNKGKPVKVKLSLAITFKL